MNRSNSRASFDVAHVSMDTLVHLFSFMIVFLVCDHSMYSGAEWLSFGVIYLVCIFVFFLMNRALYIYNNTVFLYTDRIIRRETLAYAVAVLCGAVIFRYVSSLSVKGNFIWILVTTSYAMLIIKIVFFKRLIDRIIGRKYIPRVLYVGSKDSYNKFRYFLAKTSLLINEIGYVSFDDDDESLEYIGSLSNLENIIRKYNIDQVYIIQKRDMDIVKLQGYIDRCVEMGVTCRIIIDTFRRRKSFSYISSVGTYPVYTFHTVPMNVWEGFVKRAFDVVFSLVSIVITSPVMLLTALAIKLDSKGPVIFKQVRVGKNGRHFRIWKFRSMYANAEELKEELADLNEVEDGMMFKIKNDPRITRVGRFIRKTSIDELPQFFNVLSGSMTVVGTRPPTIDEVKKYTAKQWRRISIKPGITGMWQVSGRSSVKDFDKVVELDTEYIDEWSIWLDIKIMFKTAAELFAHKNSY